MAKDAADSMLLPPEIRLEQNTPSEATLIFTGQWPSQPTAASQNTTPHAPQINYQSLSKLSFDCSDVTEWGSGFVALVLDVITKAHQSQLHVDTAGLPTGVQRLIELIERHPKRQVAAKQMHKNNLITSAGHAALNLKRHTIELVSFIGEVSMSSKAFLTGKAKIKKSDLALVMDECGPKALWIVSVISLLVGMILAFVGAIQLQQFGAQIYVANLVALAMTREMGAIMTAIIMAGRTGAAFASQLGTMQVNEEIDAFKTFGISPIHLLVLPRMLGLAIVMPMLTLYADIMGILGGAIVGVGMHGIGVSEYLHQTLESITLTDINIGLVKGFTFGILVAIAGCAKGIHCGRSAASVGESVTSAVVTSIVLIIVTDALFTFVLDVLGI